MQRKEKENRPGRPINSYFNEHDTCIGSTQKKYINKRQSIAVEFKIILLLLKPKPCLLVYISIHSIQWQIHQYSVFYSIEKKMSKFISKTAL